MEKENQKKEFIRNLNQRLPCMDQDNSGRWFVAKKPATGIEIEGMADEDAARLRLAKLLFEPNDQARATASDTRPDSQQTPIEPLPAAPC